MWNNLKIDRVASIITAFFLAVEYVTCQSVNLGGLECEFAVVWTLVEEKLFVDGHYFASVEYFVNIDVIGGIQVLAILFNSNTDMVHIHFVSIVTGPVLTDLPHIFKLVYEYGAIRDVVDSVIGTLHLSQKLLCKAQQ